MIWDQWTLVEVKRGASDFRSVYTMCVRMYYIFIRVRLVWLVSVLFYSQSG